MHKLKNKSDSRINTPSPSTRFWHLIYATFRDEDQPRWNQKGRPTC